MACWLVMSATIQIASRVELQLTFYCELFVLSVAKFLLQKHFALETCVKPREFIAAG